MNKFYKTIRKFESKGYKVSDRLYSEHNDYVINELEKREIEIPFYIKRKTSVPTNQQDLYRALNEEQSYQNFKYVMLRDNIDPRFIYASDSDEETPR